MQTYDPVSLLDLSHTLRIWADMKDSLLSAAPAFGTTVAFKSAIPAKKVCRAVRGRRFIFAYMASSVLTRASRYQLGFQGEELHIGPDTDAYVGADARFYPDGSLDVKNYGFCAPALGAEWHQALKAADVSRGNYAQWLGAEVARVGYRDENVKLVEISISRENLIRRVANVLGPSHPYKSNPEEGRMNRIDPAVAYMMKYTVAGLPIPYFILLKTAQDLLDIAPRLLHKDEPGSAA